MKTQVKPVKKAVKAKRRLSNEERYYWGLWRQIFDKFELRKTEDKDNLRHEIISEMLGKAKSQKDFTHADYDKVLGAMRSLFENGEVACGELAANAAEEDGERRRLIWNMEKLEVSQNYIAKIVLDKFSKADWRQLTNKQLKMLLITLANRLREAKRKGISLLDPQAANDDLNDNNDPF